MRKLFICLFTLLSMAASAQEAAADSTTALFGYLSYEGLLKAMPQYVIVEKEIDNLRQAYEAELKRAEEEFNQKYEAFLDGRKDFPRTILLKRQTELQQLLQRNVEFKEKGRQELEQTREEKLVPLRKLLRETIARVAHKHQLALVFNTDGNACPFIEPAMAVDLNEEVTKLLNEH